MDKLTLIKHCQLGDVSSFSDLYKLYSKPALGTAYLIAGNKGLAEDIVHEAFIKCFEGIKGLRSPETFDVWFYKIVTRTGWRIVSKNNNSLTLEDEELESAAGYNMATVSEINYCEDRMLIHEALAKLSLPLRTVVVLHYFNDMAIKDIAKVLGAFEGTIKSRLHSAKKQLRQILGEDLEKESIKTNYIGKECISNGKQ